MGELDGCVVVLSRKRIVVANVGGVQGGIGRVMKAALFGKSVARIADEHARGLGDVIVNAAGVFGKEIRELSGTSAVGQVVQPGERIAGNVAARDVR